MNDLKLNPDTWDLVIENFDLATVDGVDAIQQNLNQRLRTFLGEYFLDVRVGVPYFQEIFKKRFNPVVVDTAFKREIIYTEGIIELLSFNINIDTSTRELSLNTKVLTTEGVLKYSLII